MTPADRIRIARFATVCDTKPAKRKKASPDLRLWQLSGSGEVYASMKKGRHKKLNRLYWSIMRTKDKLAEQQSTTNI